MKIDLAPANDRGFLVGRFKDRYGANCSIQKSSIGTEDCIWLGADDIGTAAGVEPFNTRMHLTRDMAEALIPLLQHFVATGELA